MLSFASFETGLVFSKSFEWCLNGWVKSPIFSEGDEHMVHHFGGMTDEFEESTVAWGSDSVSELGSKLGSNVVG